MLTEETEKKVSAPIVLYCNHSVQVNKLISTVHQYAEEYAYDHRG